MSIAPVSAPSALSVLTELPLSSNTRPRSPNDLAAEALVHLDGIDETSRHGTVPALLEVSRLGR